MDIYDFNIKGWDINALKNNKKYIKKMYYKKALKIYLIHFKSDFIKIMLLNLFYNIYFINHLCNILLVFFKSIIREYILYLFCAFIYYYL